MVTPNAECLKKARKFQVGLKKVFDKDVKLAAFFQAETGSGPSDVQKLELLLGRSKVQYCSNIEQWILSHLIATVDFRFNFMNFFFSFFFSFIYVILFSVYYSFIHTVAHRIGCDYRR